MHNALLKLIPVIILLVLGYWGANHFSEKPKADRDKKREARKQSHKRAAQEVTAIVLNPVNYRVKLQTQGVVRSSITTSLNPLIAGKITSVSPKFQDGAFFKKNDILLELDPDDFKAQVTRAEADLARAEAALAQEKARAAQALRNWQDIGFDEEPNDLVLRKPQLKEAEANLAARKASLLSAEKNLKRTKIRAPFTGRVRSRGVGIGQSVGASTKLGEIYETSFAEVRLPLSARQLKQIEINERGDNQNIHVTLTDALDSSRTTTWDANIKHVEGELDQTSRELFVIARIEDPFAISSDKEPIRINQPVKASIDANLIENALVIPRKHIYNSKEVLIVQDGAIKRHNLNIVWETIDQVIVQNPELHDQQLLTSRINYAVDGTPVKVLEPKTEAKTDVTLKQGKQKKFKSAAKQSKNKSKRM